VWGWERREAKEEVGGSVRRPFAVGRLESVCVMCGVSTRVGVLDRVWWWWVVEVKRS
jgi:hypothetical protein